MTTDAYATSRVLALTSLLEPLGPLVNVQQLHAFVTIASMNDVHLGVPMARLGDHLGFASSTRTRIIQSLGVKRGGSGALPGLDLVTTQPDPDDSRALVIYLTPKGRRFWSSLKSIVTAGGTDGSP